MGQTEKTLLRENVFRCSPNSGHCQLRSRRSLKITECNAHRIEQRNPLDHISRYAIGAMPRRAAGRRGGELCGPTPEGQETGDLPVEQPSRFDFVVNIKTAKALGLKLPASLSVRATEVRGYESSRACGPRSFDYLVSAGDEHWWHFKANRLGGFEIDHQVELGRLLDRQFGRPRAI